MPHDLAGKLLQKGDRVFIVAIVKDIQEGDEYCNVTLETDQPMFPSDSKTTIVLNTKQTKKVEA